MANPRTVEVNERDFAPQYTATPVVEDGKVVDYNITDQNGNPVEGEHVHRVSSRGTIDCWKCYQDSQGNTHCYQVECPKGIPRLPHPDPTRIT